MQAWSDGDETALDRLVPLVEAELRRLARGYMRRERPGHTLQATELVDEAFLRLVGARHVHWQDRAHFVGIAARLMRQVLADHARSRGNQKHGGAAVRVPLDDARLEAAEPGLDLVDLNRALDVFSTIDARRSQIVELRYFGGLTLEETAEVLRVSVETVKRDWRLAKLWLLREFERRCAPSSAGATMTAEQWSRVAPILDAAIARDPDGRAAFVEEACSGDATLRREVDALLADRRTLQSKALLPGILVIGYDVSRDGSQIAFAALDDSGRSHVWIGRADGRAANTSTNVA